MHPRVQPGSSSLLCRWLGVAHMKVVLLMHRGRSHCMMEVLCLSVGQCGNKAAVGLCRQNSCCQLSSCRLWPVPASSCCGSEHSSSIGPPRQ